MYILKTGENDVMDLLALIHRSTILNMLNRNVR